MKEFERNWKLFVGVGLMGLVFWSAFAMSAEPDIGLPQTSTVNSTPAFWRTYPTP
jgi:hypothetical protein